MNDKIPSRAQAANGAHRTALDKESLQRAFLDNLFYVQGKFPGLATRRDYYMALAFTVRDHLLQRWVSAAAAYTRRGSRTVAYLSAEFLMGPHLANNLVSLGIHDPVREAIGELGIDFEALLAEEPEPGLGNGGLGRLAACFLDSLATLEVPCVGYGIRYEFGIFQQAIENGWQVELTDKWLHTGNPWELPRPEWSVEVKFGGRTERQPGADGRMRTRWTPERTVVGVPYDTPILGFRNHTANTLRLWRAEAADAFDLAEFNRGDYYKAVDRKVTSENLTKVLYPNDEMLRGKELRLEQQYFFVACSLGDMLRIMRNQGLPIERFHEKFAVQLNDTHPAIAVAELMRLLVDELELEWDAAWSIVRRSFGYTNHTLMPEALERWPVAIFAKLLPRHLEIIYEINERFLAGVRERFPGDGERIARLSLIEEWGPRYVRMAHLACVGSHSVNGVAELHSELLKRDVLADFHALWPERFHNVTNGVSPRRWMVVANPLLSDLIGEAIGPDWVMDLERLRELEPLAQDAGFRERWRAVKRANRTRFAAYLQQHAGVAIDPDSLFDVQVKRIHEYKRQHLGILHVIALYRRLIGNPQLDCVPRTFVFGGKAAPGYFMAKLIIKLINSVGEVVNRHPLVRDRIKLVFVPNFNVSTGQRIYPAADLSEQISTAGKEASGTGNMKFALNGALTIGTLDGANIEIRDAVGAENLFAFGHSVEQVAELWRSGYRPEDLYLSDEELRGALDLIREGGFSGGDRELFRPLIDNLLGSDPYLVLADFRPYLDCQRRVDRAFLDPEAWARMSILNCARSHRFSSDRSIREYCEKIWRVSPVVFELLSPDSVKDHFLQ